MTDDEIGFNIKKEENFSEWYSELLKAADIVDQRYPLKGFIVHKEIATIAEREMYRMLEAEMDRRGHKPMMFPALIPESVFAKEKEHIEGFTPEVFWVDYGGVDKLPERVGMRPTSETPMYTMYSMWIRSWRDLPLKVYQRAQVWRYETKHTRPLFRDREFHWIEAHNCFATKAEAEAQVLEDMDITETFLHQQLGVPFFFFRRPEWDKFKGAVDTFGADAFMPNGIVIQLPSTHMLGQNFSVPYNVKFTTEDEKDAYVWQTCYGPCISRIFAAVISMHGDNKGLILPWSIAPCQVVIIPVLRKDSDKAKIIEHCKSLQKKLRNSGIRVEIDDSDKRPGSKYYYWELKGACLRMEIGLREIENAEITVARRDNGKKETVKENDLGKYLADVPSDILKNLRAVSDAAFANCIHEAKTMDELKAQVEKGGFTRVNFCSRAAEGEACADVIKEKSGGGEVRGTLHGKDEVPNGACIVCGKKANAVVYVAKSY